MNILEIIKDIKKDIESLRSITHVEVLNADVKDSANYKEMF